MKRLSAIFNSQLSGLVILVALLVVVLTHYAGTHVDRTTGQVINNFLNPSTLMQVATDTSFFAIMAVGSTMVIISGGIDLSVGSIYALAGVLMAMFFEGHAGIVSPWLAISLCMGIGLICGALNGVMICNLGVHPFVITLGMMWVFRGIAFVSTGARSILVPDSLTHFTKSNLGLRPDLFPVPMVVTILVAILGTLFLERTAMGRRVFAVGGNVEASRYSGLRLKRILTGVYIVSGVAAGLAAFLGCTFYGSATSGDGQGYELYVIASAVVGGTSLSGGKGSAFGALLGALLIAMIRQSIRTLHLDQNYEWIIIGVAIIVAVVLDRLNSRLAERRLSQQGAANRLAPETPRPQG